MALAPITAAELKEFIEALPGDLEEWTPLADYGHMLRFFRRDPDDPESLGWTRAWLNTLSGERDVSDAPPTEAVGKVFPDSLFGPVQPKEVA